MSTKKQYYKHHVFVCANTRPANHPMGSCGGKMNFEVVAYMKEKAVEMGLEGVRINASGCLGRCDDAPVAVVYPEGVWCQLSSREDADQILNDHLKNGKPVARLMLSD